MNAEGSNASPELSTSSAQPNVTVGSKARARYVTFPPTLHAWLESEFKARGYDHVNELIIDIVRKAWEREQAAEPATNGEKAA
jgi:hypothetical protein